MKKMFNKSFGATFLTGTGQESAFAYHIHQYADVYTSEPENFLLYQQAWLHVPSHIKIMPHHVKGCRNSETDCISCFCFLSKGIELIILLLNVGSRCPIIFLVDVIVTQDCSIEGMMLDFNSGEKKYFLFSRSRLCF
ncbi:hypothetical protein Peur_045468 [Populus x canadensis]